MKIECLRLDNFRNYKHQEISFGDHVNVLLGDNAQGKTNALESIYFLAMGKSHRASRDQDCIYTSADSARIDAKVSVKKRNLSLRLEIATGGKRALVNGLSQTKMTDFVGHFQVVLFAPEDLQLIKGSPGLRRRFIDMEIGQTHPKYLYHLAHYQRVLQQRNTLLKQPHVDWDYVSVFDEQLSDHGSEVICRRANFLQALANYASTIYDNISMGKERLHIYYVNTVLKAQSMNNGDELSKPDIRDKLRELFVSKRSVDAQMGHTTVGPHRDDLAFTLNNVSVQSFASQGQQRSIALALRLAEIDLIYNELGDYPVLLLDDVMSELDDNRQRNLILTMQEKVQTLVTTATMGSLNKSLQGRMRLFHVHSGIIDE